jgi:hypothetical protein
MKVGTTAESAPRDSGVVKSRSTETGVPERWTSESLTVETATTVHPTEGSTAADMAAESAPVAGSDSVAAATVATAMLREGRRQR